MKSAFELVGLISRTWSRYGSFWFSLLEKAVQGKRSKLQKKKNPNYMAGGFFDYVRRIQLTPCYGVRCERNVSLGFTSAGFQNE